MLAALQLSLVEGVVVVNENLEHKRRREASFVLFLKSFFMALVLMNLMWVIGAPIMRKIGCSNIKSFETICGCSSTQKVAESGRYFVLQLWPQVLGWVLLLYKIMKVRHGVPIKDDDVVRLLSRARLSSVSLSAMLSSSESKAPEESDFRGCSPLPHQYLENREEGDTDTVPFSGVHLNDVMPLNTEGVHFVVKEMVRMYLVFHILLIVVTAVASLTVGAAYALFIFYTVYRLKKLAITLNPRFGAEMVKPLTAFLLVMVFEAATITLLTAFLEKKPDLRNMVVTGFPLLISAYEILTVDVVGKLTGHWSAEDASMLARMGVATLESFRAGILLAAANMKENTSALSGPFFRTALLGVVVDAAVRNDIHGTLIRKIIQRKTDEQVMTERPRFTIIYMGTKTDGGYVAWVVAACTFIHNTCPTTSMVDCDMKPYYVYSPPVAYLVVAFASELAADLLAAGLRIGIGKLRPLWRMPLYHVSPEGTMLVRALFWLGLLSTALVGMIATGMLLDRTFDNPYYADSEGG